MFPAKDSSALLTKEEEQAFTKRHVIIEMFRPNEEFRCAANFRCEINKVIRDEAKSFLYEQFGIVVVEKSLTIKTMLQSGEATYRYELSLGDLKKLAGRGESEPARESA